MKLSLGPEYELNTDDYAAEGTRFNAMGMSGSGKSNTTAILAEQIIEQGGQIIVVEPVAEWHTLKANYSNIVVIGGPFQDLPIDIRFIPEYVETALANGINLVVNVSDYDTEEEQRDFVSRFLRSLYAREQRHRKPVFLFLEEADIWAPQMYDKFSKPCRDVVRTIAKRGRKVGIFMAPITQRPADVDKTAVSQCNISIFGKFALKQDLEGVMYYAKKLNPEIKERDFMELKVVKGEYAEFFVSDLNGFRKIRIPFEMRKTPHGADTPDIEYAPVLVELAPVLEDLKRKLEEAMVAKDAEETRITKLEKELEKARRDILDRDSKLKLAGDLRELLSPGAAPIDKADVAEKIMEMEKEHETELAQLKETWTPPEKVEIMQDYIKELEQQVEAVDLLTEILTPIIEPIVKKMVAIDPMQIDEKTIRDIIDKKIAALPAQKRRRIETQDTGIPWVDLYLPKLKSNEAKILRYIAKKHPLKLSRRDISMGTGISFTSSGLNAGLTKLKKWRLIEQIADDYELMEGPP